VSATVTRPRPAGRKNRAALPIPVQPPDERRDDGALDGDEEQPVVLGDPGEQGIAFAIAQPVDAHGGAEQIDAVSENGEDEESAHAR